MLIYVAWKRSASIANVMSASEATRLLPLDQNATADCFSHCDAAETGEETEPVPDLPNKTSCTVEFLSSTSHIGSTPSLWNLGSSLLDHLKC
jgi:hypothetical protein